MTDDRIVKDTARDPEREALGPMHGGARATAKGAARKVAKSVGQKKAARKTTAAAGRATKKAAKSAAKTDKPAPAKAATPTSREISTTRARVAAAGKTATTASTAALAPEPAAAGSTEVAEGVASPPATSAAALPEPGPAIETPRPPPAPMHPGASMDSMQEQAGGLGGVLALWGPLIIVGFLVLVFRGGGEHGSTPVTRPDATARAATEAVAETGAARGQQVATAGETATGVEPVTEARPSERIPAPPGTVHGVAEAFDGGFTMRTSMASPPTFAGHGPDAGRPTGAPGRLYPSPPGPYRDPRYRGLPTGESWSAAGTSEWLWPAEGAEDPRHEDGADAPTQWVPCAPPYYWCPPPVSPVW